jgi:hypothetical protein
MQIYSSGLSWFLLYLTIFLLCPFYFAVSSVSSRLVVLTPLGDSADLISHSCFREKLEAEQLERLQPRAMLPQLYE